MVEELKLAIKIDDATIEQSLLKQFANAQKMADKVVLDFKNVNFDDKQIEAKFKEMQKKAGQNPIDLTIGGNTLDMLGQIDKRLTEIFSIGKGKSFIDSSSIATDIGKIENKINELNKKYEESQKKLSSIGSGGISGKDVNLVDNEEFKKLSQEVSELKNQFDDLKTHMQLLDDYTVPTDRFFELQSQVETTTVKVSDLVEEFAKLSNAQKALSSTPQESNISFGDSTSNAIDTQVKKQREYNDLVAVGYDRIQKMKKISESGTTGQNSVYDLLRLNHEAWDEVKANNFFNTIPEEGLKRYTKILEVVEKIVQEMVQASGLTEDQIVSQLKNIKSAQGGNFKLNGADSGWTHFATYSNGQKDSMRKPNGITYKVYAAFDDIKDLNQNVVSSIMDELTKAGFKGRLKTTSGSTSFGDKLNGLAITDQMVVHGSTKKDQEIAYNTLKNMGLKLSYLGGGIDTPDGSFSQTLASGEINKYVQGLEKEATTARDTAKAEQELANARKESTSTVSQNQKKDAFPKTSENLEQVAQSEQKVQQEAVATDKALDNISFTPNTEGFDDIIAKFGILREQAEQITKIVKTTKQTADGTPDISYKATLRNGSSYYLGENSTPQVLNASETVYDAKAVAKNAEQEAKAIQAEWDKNIKAIQDYMDAMTKLNNLKAKDKGTGSEANQIELQAQNVEKLKQVAWDARKNLSSMQAENPDIIAWKQWVDMMELFDQASKGSAESAAKLKDVLDNIKVPSLDKYENKLASYQTKKGAYNATIARFNDGGWTSDEYLKNVQAVKDAVKKYEDLLNNIKAKGGIASEDDVQNLKEYESEIKKTISTVTNMSAAEKGYNFVSGQKELDKIHKLLNENSKMSSEAKAKIKAYYKEIESGNPSMSLDRIHGEIMKIYNAEVEAGRAGKSLWDTFKTSRLHQIVAQAAGMFGFYDIINIGKQAVEVVTELDSAFTEMRKVSDETEQSLKRYQQTTFTTADAIGTTAVQIQKSTANWQRLGYSLDEASKLAENSNIYKNVGDMDINEATEHMISSVQAWKSEFGDAVTASEEIMNRYNKIGNEFAISSADIGEAMETSAAALKAGGNDLNESIGLITAGNLIQQDASTTASAMKILSLRIRGAKADLDAMGESTDDLSDSTSKMREELKALTGVDIMKDENTFKSTAEIIQEMGKNWDKLTDVSKAAALEKLAGKNRASTVSGLIENYETIGKVIEAAENSENSALEENEKYLESIEGRTQKLTNQLQELASATIKDDWIKDAISGLTTLLDLVTKLVDKFGIIPTVAPAIAAALSFKNVGILELN